MSGIGVIYHRDGRPVLRDDIERVARALTMYGPEKQTVRLMGPVAFAYTHFTNTPEARGQMQPVTGGDGRHTMVFDGRLDNREELGAELGLDLAALRMLSDATLAMRCWERWGTDTLNRWIGEFALINWDKSDARLIAARHQFGYRTLHYHQKQDRLVIASAPKGIHALGDIPREIDEQKIADALSMLYTDAERTYFKDISRVAPASLLIADKSKVENRQYYKIEDHIRDVRYAKDDDYVEAARELFETSVKATLRSPGPVGSFMSGGLDSSTTAITAANILSQKGNRLPTFTWVPEDGWDGLTEAHCYGDETPYVKAIAAQYPAIDLNLIDAKGFGHYHKQEELLHAMEMPIRNALNVNWLHAILQEAKERGIKVMLSGDMGNMTLSYRGDGIYTHLWRQREYRQLFKELVYLNRNPIAFTRRAFTELAGPLAPDWFWHLKEWLRGRGNDDRDRWLRYVAINPEVGREMRIPERAKATGFNFFGRPPAIERDLWIWMLTRHVASENGDIMQGFSAMYGIEMRDPFSNRRLMEWCLGVPEEQFHRDGVGRHLIKRLMKGVLPDSVLFKPLNVGRQNSDWHLRMTRDLPRMREDLKQFSADPDIARMIDIPRLEALLDDWPDQTVTKRDDDRSFFLPVHVPLALQAGRFVQRVKGVNLP
jgi:asparagine synthase (glutamine-hydrolysing)